MFLGEMTVILFDGCTEPQASLRMTQSRMTTN